MKLFLNIYKSYYTKERDYRINSILHPKYFLDASVIKGQDDKRHEGWKYDMSYQIVFSDNVKWSNMMKHISYKHRLLIIEHILLLFTNTTHYKYKNLHALLSNSLSDSENEIVESIYDSHTITQDDILQAAIAVDSILLTYFQNRLTIYNPLEYPLKASISYCDMYVYCKVDFHRCKVRVLFGNHDILQHKYDAPLIPILYESTPNNPMLANILFTLQDRNYLEVLYRWLENILEQVFIVTKSKDKYFIVMQEVEELIQKHPKTDLFYTILHAEHFSAMIGVIGQIKKRIQHHLLKSVPTAEIMASTKEQLDDKLLIENPIQVNVYPTKMEDRMN